MNNHLPGDSAAVTFSSPNVGLVTNNPLKGSRELTIPKRSPAELSGSRDHPGKTSSHVVRARWFEAPKDFLM